MKQLLRLGLACLLVIAPILPVGAVDLSSTDWSEIDNSNNQSPPNGWPAGMAPNSVEPTARAGMGALKRFWNRINCTLTSTGSANAYVLTPANTTYPAAYSLGETYCFTANFTNTGAATLNVNGIGAQNIYKQTTVGPQALVGGEIVNGNLIHVSYDGNEFQIAGIGPAIVANPGTAVTNTSGTTFTAADIASGGILRSGPSALFTDTTDTAANIVGVYANSAVGYNFTVTIYNSTAYAESLVGGTGVTIQGSAIIASGQTVILTGTMTNVTSGTQAVTLANPTVATSSPVLLNFGTISSAGALQITSGFTSAYSTYEIRVFNVVPASPSTALALQVSTNGGSSYIAANYSYAYIGYAAGGPDQNGLSGQVEFALTGSNVMAAAPNGEWIIDIVNPSLAATKTKVRWRGTYTNSGSSEETISGGGQNSTTSPVNAVQIFAPLINVSMNWELWGYP